MTVCIAAITRHQEIVFASDQMASLESVSADHAMSKVDFLTPFWMALWAGDDITSIPPLMRRAREAVKEHGRDATVQQVSQAVATAYQEETRERAVAEHLSIYDLDMPEFLSNGSNIFGDAGFSLMQERIERVDLGLSILVCGFTPLGPTIFTVERGGVTRYYERLGFWAIGSGNHLAASSLAFRNHNATRALDETIYNVCEAKFRAEMASGVGKTTTLGYLTRGGPVVMPIGKIAPIRAEWERFGKPPIPEAALEYIRGWLNPPPAPNEPEQRQ